jgi:uncharacterized protein YozE (UPF0346 family)
MAETTRSTCVSVQRWLTTAATTRRESSVWRQLGYQPQQVPGDAHDTKSLQFDRSLDQTFQEHEFPLRYVDWVETSKYLMKLMLFNIQTLSTCTDSWEEP